MRPVDADEVIDTINYYFEHTQNAWQMSAAFIDGMKDGYARARSIVLRTPTVDTVQLGWWNNHEVACLIADLFGDPCACNFNGIDEWLPTYCDFSSTCCPNPDGVACWEQYLKHLDKRHDEVEE